jgi:hypothetical protein
MKRFGRALLWLTLFAPALAFAQIDPVKRDLIQIGYNAAFEGRAPLAGYAFFYHNQPDFLRTNLTLRLALAPVYLDSELGFVSGLGPNTDFAIGVAGGGFADSYNEIRGGTYLESESFNGNGGEISASIYHLFNPGDQIPLNFVLRGTAHYSFFNCPTTTVISACAPACAGAASSRLCFRRSRWNYPSGTKAICAPIPARMVTRLSKANSRSNRICFGRRRRWLTRCPKASKAFMSA